MEFSHINRDVIVYEILRHVDGPALVAFIHTSKWTNGLIDLRLKEYTRETEPQYIVLPNGAKHGIVSIGCDDGDPRYHRVTYSNLGVEIPCLIRFYTEKLVEGHQMGLNHLCAAPHLCDGLLMGRHGSLLYVLHMRADFIIRFNVWEGDRLIRSQGVVEILKQ